MKKTVYFSDYIKEEKIKTNPVTNNDAYRYAISIPFKNRKGGSTAVVIMKNPSKAGRTELVDGSTRRISDDTVYKVCDYLYKQERFAKVIILNLFARFGSVFSNIKHQSVEEILEGETGRNNQVVEKILNDLEEEDVIILGWGGYPKLEKDGLIKRNDYRDRIRCVLNLLDDRELYVVGELTGEGFPQHGNQWYDFDPVQKVQRKSDSSYLLELDIPKGENPFEKR